MSFIDRTAHISKFGGDIWYINAGSGNDSNGGKRPDDAFATIGQGITSAAAGDAINVKAGTYDENGLDMNLAGLELWGEIGALLVDTTTGTQTLLISANSCRVSGIKISQASQIGIKITGAGCMVHDVMVEDATVAYDIDGDQTLMVRNQSMNATTTGYDISTAENLFYLCNSIAAGGAVRGFYLSNSAADQNMLYQVLSSGNGTAGYEVVSGATRNIIALSCSGGGDGARVDLGSRTQWCKFDDKLPREHHEEVYPQAAGEGVAAAPITVTNLAQDETATQDDQWYWGEPHVLVAPAAFTGIWSILGYNIFATTANKEMQANIYRINHGVQSAKNGGNAWDEGATVLTVVDGSKFQTDDLVWIYSDYKTDGEIVKVSSVSTNDVTIARETVASGRTGLRWDHTTNDAGTEVMYLVYRDSLTGMHPIMFNYSAGSAKDFSTVMFHIPKEYKANDGILVRMMNLTDALAATFDMTILFED
jgi:hypothetical protein